MLALGALQAEERVADAFRTGAGIGRHEPDHGVFVIMPNHVQTVLVAE